MITKTMKAALSLLLFTLFTIGNITAQSDEECAILHNGTFTYGEADNIVTVKIEGENHMEYHNEGKYYIKSKLIWVNECEYNMTMKKVTIPNFPYGKGDVMNVKVSAVEGNVIKYTSTVQGQSWEGIITKIE